LNFCFCIRKAGHAMHARPEWMLTFSLRSFCFVVMVENVTFPYNIRVKYSACAECEIMRSRAL
jgi:hypothetical protein